MIDEHTVSRGRFEWHCKLFYHAASALSLTYSSCDSTGSQDGMVPVIAFAYTWK